MTHQKNSKNKKNGDNTFAAETSIGSKLLARETTQTPQFIGLAPKQSGLKNGRLQSLGV